MIKVIIADDEQLFREGLVADVNWDRIGMNVVGLASDGREALELVRIQKPDIVVTDIRMPYIDGLEFIAEAKEIKPDIHFIIISGHDEFEYARKAVRLGVSEFLLKPLDDYELENALLKRKELIDKNRKTSIEKTLRDIMLRLENRADFNSSDNFRIIVIQMDDYNTTTGKADDFYKCLEKHTVSAENIFVLERRNGELIITVSAPNEALLAKNTRNLIKSLRSDDFCSKYSITIGIGDPVEGIENLNTSRLAAENAVSRKFLKGKNKTFYHEEHEDEKLEENPESNAFDYSIILSALKTGTVDELNSSIESLIKNTARMGKDSFAYGLMITGNIFSESLKIVDLAGGSSAELFENAMEVYRQITSCPTMEEMFNELKKNLSMIMSYLSMRRGGSQQLLLDKVIAYMKQNLSDSALSLQGTADKFNISSGHLCNIFNNYGDETFKEMLTRFRIQKARDLIAASDFMIYEICYEVGYNNPAYFNSVFKKQTGLSPGAYKKKITGGNLK